jgi:type II restriction/modification system DNA methylase subunit YeeA
MYFQEVFDKDLHLTIDSVLHDPATNRHNPRFVIVTDYKTLLASDTKTNEHLDISLPDLKKHFDFFLPWAGIEKHRHQLENPADRKAAEKMAKLYDEILADNEINTDSRIHDLNVFLARLLFCFFAEDTNIFEVKLFTDSVASHTQGDGSDLDNYLHKLFEVLNTENNFKYPAFLQKFPYVNGGLFAKKHWIPKFSLRARKTIIECGELNWSEINPDIFGSMMQAVVHPGIRGGLGMHYTSVPNIMKVIEPLFLNDLKDEFSNSIGNNKKLNELRIRMSKMKFFDPACGSGNFLIISYKEIRRLEIAIIQEMGTLSFSDIKISQFYGIEIDDFAHEIAKLSLYLAEHQMNLEFYKNFGRTTSTLPLKTGGNIICANATRISWEAICPKNYGDEIYVLGNPPYLGSRNQDKEQKEDMKIVFEKNYKSLDYISCWFYLGSKYIKGSNGKLGFVSTNSISQGEQVALLWPLLLKDGNLEIFFAHQSFKWTNSAKRNAGVTVIIIGICNAANNSIKRIYNDGSSLSARVISPYLTPTKYITVTRRPQPLSNLPEMTYGNMPLEGGFLKLSIDEKNKLTNNNIMAVKFVRKLIGGDEFLKGHERFCLWIDDKDLNEALQIQEIKERIESVYKFRINGGDVAKTLVDKSHQFRYRTEAKNNFIVIPCTSSERRQYIPCGFYDKSFITLNSVQVIYDPELWIFGILSSRIHMAWVRTVAGRLKTDYRYSSALCYNTFPITSLTSKTKQEIMVHVYNVLEVREKYSEETIAEMYDPDKMPEELRDAHYHLDLAVERCYRSKPFSSDEERLEYLFKLYEKMIEEEKLKNRLY